MVFGSGLAGIVAQFGAVGTVFPAARAPPPPVQPLEQRLQLHRAEPRPPSGIAGQRNRPAGSSPACARPNGRNKTRSGAGRPAISFVRETPGQCAYSRRPGLRSHRLGRERPRQINAADLRAASRRQRRDLDSITSCMVSFRDFIVFPILPGLRQTATSAHDRGRISRLSGLDRRRLRKAGEFRRNRASGAPPKFGPKTAASNAHRSCYSVCSRKTCIRGGASR